MDKPVALPLQTRPLLSKSKTFVAMLSVTIVPLKQTVVLSPLPLPPIALAKR